MCLSSPELLQLRVCQPFFLPKHWGVALGLFIHLALNLLAALVASTCGLPLPFSRLRHNFID